MPNKWSIFIWLYIVKCNGRFFPAFGRHHHRQQNPKKEKNQKKNSFLVNYLSFERIANIIMMVVAAMPLNS